ncbi:MAG TPA: cytosine deaminase, partial [Paracoccus sp. (in: a-proteobacteria)]|nr:cytosine deaminase [Paracoccus sp. (in: a-proteobacteria)]
MDFRALPSGDLTLTNLTAPGCLTGSDKALESITLSIRARRITAPAADLPQIDMGGAMVFPTFTDMHTHLDKGHIWPRAANPDGTFDGALAMVEADRDANWSGPDVRARMDFGLRCAFAHGTSAMRTHLDSIAPQHRISFPEFTRLRDEWAGRIALQAACLTLIDRIDPEGGGEFADLADL